ncbi:MAG: TraR/DksA C4-type zinc finger protein [Halobacteriovoraceae bacterium]|nr:TraR/DksA C4-type zinc finger protein [Halobacteriovoraceae bacterium]MCB9095218.1 TraR/DksA C4-type zinc finger protein [Halobacteriovoraceae bacterium]
METTKKSEVLKLINERLQELDSTIESLKEKIKPVAPDVSLGRLTRMEAIQEKAVAEENFRKANEEKINLLKTLKRIQDDEFGYCQLCGNEIPWKRIKAVPYGRSCIECLNDLEA